MTKVRKPNIVRGGIAIPLGRNYYFMRGRKHEQGGIDIGKNPRTGLEVEDGEVMHIGDKDVKVFSSLPFLNGESPAQRVIKGENPNRVFNDQERYKRKNKINDDGTRKAEWGMKEGSNADIATDMIPIVGSLKEVTRLIRNPSWEQAGWTAASIGSDLLGAGIGKLLVKSAKAAKLAREARALTKPTRVIHPKIAKTIGSAVTATGDSFINNLQGSNNKIKKRMGGLSRSKDYGSKSKPYPKVNKKDFAGKGRSYPIPTKADAVDALRLAGLHGRSDVRAKVYSKYPELRKKAKVGGLYTLSINGKETLHPFSSTGDKQYTPRQELTGSAKMRYGGKRRKARYGDDLIYPNNNTEIVNWMQLTKENNDFLNRTKPNPTTPDVPWQRIPKTQNEIDYDNKISSVPQYLRRPYEQRNDTISTPKVKNNRNIFTRIGSYFKENPNAASDIIGLTSNIGSTLIGSAFTNKAINKMKYSKTPIPLRATKLKTRININPQLDRMKEGVAEYERNVNRNTGSSQVALSRNQIARLRGLYDINSLYQDKENKETELINADRTNQQAVANQNIAIYNDWSANKTAFENTIAEEKANNKIAAINNINAGVQQTVDNIQKRISEDKTLNAMSLGNPNLPAEMLYASGIWTKEMYDTYRKAYPLNKNNTYKK